MNTYTSPTDTEFYTDHDDATLQVIVDRYTAQSAAMHPHPLAEEAMQIANAAWAELTRRQVEAKVAA